MIFKQSQPAQAVLTYNEAEQQSKMNKYMMFCILTCMGLLFATMPAEASTTGTDFKALYDFIYDAATGYLGRGICLFGGLVGLGIAASSGKVIPAIIGVVLAIFGTLGPTIVNNLFSSAII